MPGRSKLAVLVVLLTLLTMAGCFLGCVRQFKPVPIEEGQIPEGVKKRVEEALERTFTSVKDFAWYVLDEHENGLFVVATCRGNPRHPTTLFRPDLTYYVWGHLREVREDGQSAWSGTVGCYPLLTESSGPTITGSDFGGEITPGGEIGIYAAGWAVDPRAAKVVLVRDDGEEFSCVIKNGFWWTGPHNWGNYWPDKAVVYDKSGKVLHEGIFPPRLEERPWR